jgi:hypothetical protein
MDFGQFSLPVMIIAIIYGARTIRQFIDSSERRFEIRMNAQRDESAADHAGIQALREELARFRESATQYDLSVEDKLKRLEDRMSFMEQRSLAPRPAVPAAAPETQQVIGSRD